MFSVLLIVAVLFMAPDSSPGHGRSNSAALPAPDEPCDLILRLVLDDHYDSGSTYRLIVSFDESPPREIFNQRIDPEVPKGRPYGLHFQNWYELPIHTKVSRLGLAPSFRVSLVEALDEDWVSISSARLRCPQSRRAARTELAIEPPPYNEGKYTMIVRPGDQPHVIRFSWR
jgi:hypothetical protein